MEYVMNNLLLIVSILLNVILIILVFKKSKKKIKTLKETMCLLIETQELNIKLSNLNADMLIQLEENYETIDVLLKDRENKKQSKKKKVGRPKKNK